MNNMIKAHHQHIRRNLSQSQDTSKVQTTQYISSGNTIYIKSWTSRNCTRI